MRLLSLSLFMTISTLSIRNTYSLLSLSQHTIKNYSIISSVAKDQTQKSIGETVACQWKNINSCRATSHNNNKKQPFQYSRSIMSSASNTMNTDGMKTETSASTNDHNNNLDSIAIRIDNTWIRELSTETTDNYQKSLKYIGSSTDNNNKVKRPIYNGHYVLVKPTGIPNPKLLIYSKEFANQQLGINDEQMTSQDMINWLSGNKVLDETWATPYALSIMGTRYQNNCPFGTGDGYGDGRAISIGEVVHDDQRYEIQLKGSGKTPFCRGGDGRAVLRSSIREYLASESLYYMNISTTRALSLIVSANNAETVSRPWYSNGTKLVLPDIYNDSRLTKYTDEEKKTLISQIRESNRADPNMMQSEPVAIASRVATSFIRIGHFDLFARRVEKFKLQNNGYNEILKDSLQMHELTQLLWHALYREYKDISYDTYINTNDIVSASKVLLKQSAIDISKMIANWIRIGFVQGNFNADNCLIAGRTMDYGPFGFVDEYNPVAAKWTGSGQHFGFMNQPTAGLANYQILVESIIPILLAYNTNNDNNEHNGIDETILTKDLLDEYMESATKIFENAVDEVFRIKLGFISNDMNGDNIWKQLEPLIRSSRTDWTILFRSLTYMIRDYPIQQLSNENNNDNYRINEMLSKLEGADTTNHDYPGAFYEPLTDKQRTQWIELIMKWRTALSVSLEEEKHSNSEDIYNHMKQTNPKYILREWMLVNAYTPITEDVNNQIELNNLYELIQHPYEEGTVEEIQKYYRKASDEDLVSGGTAFMSCSS